MAFKFVASLMACVLPVLVSAQIYTWKDADGRTHYSDLPPTGTASKSLRGNSKGTPQYDTGSAGKNSAPKAAGSAPAANGSAPVAGGSAPAANASGPKTWEERDRDFKKRQADKAEAEAKAKKAEQEKAEKAEFCSRAKNQLSMLEQGGRMSQANAAGEKEYMSDAQIQAEANRLRSQISKDCN